MFYTDQQSALSAIELDKIVLPIAVSRLAPEEPSSVHLHQAEITYHRWNGFYQRSVLWQHACAFLRYANVHLKVTPKRIFEKIQQLNSLHHAKRMDVLDEIENKFLGQVYTVSREYSSRLSYWRLLQMRYEGVIPTDIVDLGPFGEYVLAALREMEDINRYCDQYLKDRQWAEEAGDERERGRLANRLHNQAFDRRAYDTSYQALLGEHDAKIVRKWASLYIDAGYAANELCIVKMPQAARGRVFDVYLTKPRQKLADERAKPLSYWLRYGLKGLVDLTERRGHAMTSLPRELPLTEEGLCKTPYNYYYSLFPLAYRPRIVLMAEEVQDDVYSDIVDSPPRSALDILERHHFGQVVTSGSVKGRIKYWTSMARQYRAEHLERLRDSPPKINQHLYWTEITTTARAWILAGEDPEGVCSLIARGRGGLGKPKPQEDAGVGDVALNHWVSTSFANDAPPITAYSHYAI